jgi:hypothetical protein
MHEAGSQCWVHSKDTPVRLHQLGSHPTALTLSLALVTPIYMCGMYVIPSHPPRSAFSLTNFNPSLCLCTIVTFTLFHDIFHYIIQIMPSATVPHVPTMWMLAHDGWLVDSHSRPLVWVPPDLRKAILGPRCIFCISVNGFIQLAFENARLGELWTDCYMPA